MEANQLNGTIPSELGNLKKLDILSVHHNSFVGRIPQQLCLIHEMNPDLALVADCSEVVCECCTLCCLGCDGDNEGVLVERTSSPTTTPSADPTSGSEPLLSPIEFFDEEDKNTTQNDSEAPTEFGEMEDWNITQIPSPSPTGLLDTLGPVVEDQQGNGRIAPQVTPAALSPVPTDDSSLLPNFPGSCELNLSLFKSCYERNEENIQVEFQNCDATDTDWIGLFHEKDVIKDPVGEEAPFLDKAELWLQPCGDQKCSTPEFSNSISLGRATVREGEYKVVLVRQDVTVATTEKLEVRRKCKEKKR